MQESTTVDANQVSNAVNVAIAAGATNITLTKNTNGTWTVEVTIP